jgi:hypothetical protein
MAGERLCRVVDQTAKLPWKDAVLLIPARPFLPASKIGLRTTSHLRHQACTGSMPEVTEQAAWNDLKLNIGLVTRLMAR